MCKAIQDMNNMARQEGRQEGHLETLRDSIKNVMESFNVGVEDAMKALKVSQEDQDILRPMI